MPLNLKSIESLLIQKENRPDLLSIVVEYIRLTESLENTDQHSWYYKKGIESYKRRLVLLREDFETIREYFNESSIDSFLDEINKNNAHISAVTSGGMNAVVYWSCSLLRDKNKSLTELIRLKSNTEILKPLDYYLENLEEFLNVVT